MRGQYLVQVAGISEYQKSLWRPFWQCQVQNAAAPPQGGDKAGFIGALSSRWWARQCITQARAVLKLEIDQGNAKKCNGKENDPLESSQWLSEGVQNLWNLCDSFPGWWHWLAPVPHSPSPCKPPRWGLDPSWSSELLRFGYQALFILVISFSFSPLACRGAKH